MATRGESTAAPAARPRRQQGISFAVTAGLLVMVTVVLAWRGWEFYGLDLGARVLHEEYRALRPSGRVGHGYGIVGTILILTNLLYLARRRLARFQLGSMRTWLDLHVFTGLVGAMFVLFHSAFQARALIAQVTGVSLAVVVLTGIVGRFLYALAPAAGAEQLAAALDALEEQTPGLRAQIRAVMAEHPIPVGGSSLLRDLATIPRWRRVARDREEAIDLIVSNAPQRARLQDDDRGRVDELGRQAAKAARAEARAAGARALLQSWRSMHRFFAILMVLAVVVHVAVAWHYGYRWMLSE